MLIKFCNIKTVGAIFFVVISVQVNINLALAHNNVVVIPMAGDEVFVEQTPTTPIANVNTSQQGTYIPHYMLDLLTIMIKRMLRYMNLHI